MAQNNQTAGRAIIIALPCLSVVVVVLRLYSRIARTYIGPDDWFILIACLLSVSLIYPSLKYFETLQLGLHTSEVQFLIDNEAVSKWIYIVQVLYNPTLLLIKCSVLLFLQRLGQNLDHINKWVSALFWFNIVWMVLLEFVAIFQCNPVAKAWNPTITYGHCINTRALFTFSSVLAIVTDLLTLIPPIWVFSKMNIRGRLKVVVLATFLLGFVVTALSCWRLYSLVRVLYFPDTIPDFFFDISFVSSTFEINIAIITASVPALRALVTKGISARYPGVLPIANQAARPRDGEFPLSIGSQPFRLILRKVHDSILHPTHQREQPLALAESINETTNTTTRFPSVGTGGSTAVAASNDLGPDRVSRDKRGSVGRCIGYQD